MPAYTPFPERFPGYALIDALQVIKDKAVNTPAGKLQLAHSGWELSGWALGALTEGTNKPAFSLTVNPLTGLSDTEAMELLDQVTAEPADDDGTVVMAACPITPAMALKLAGWLFKVAEIVLPVIL
ncbi:hypothetical protein UFOVP124_29 [uncultured Caudovirales phage]|uniref:Uncharacterized protein n=1 Tax=uncultured Caudovirales phage TaxID=2100421 RepID=A0A6J5L9V5_9CAUD|nr:hypothetical protein UFOVP124_29 [uncultured Caudovirales phage]